MNMLHSFTFGFGDGKHTLHSVTFNGIALGAALCSCLLRTAKHVV